MRLLFVALFGCVLVLGADAVTYSRAQTPVAKRDAQAKAPSAQTILREASELAMKQGEQEHYWIDRILLQIGDEQIRAGDFDGALRSIRGSTYEYGRDVALARLTKARAGQKDRATENEEPSHYSKMPDDVASHIGKRDFNVALTATEKIDNPSRKALAILKIATAQAKAGDRKAAADNASQIKLTHNRRLLRHIKHEVFDYRSPKTWGQDYDVSDGITMASLHASTQLGADVAAAAMELAQALECKPTQSYAELFGEIIWPEITQSLARAHAAFGDPGEALAWAKQIGSDVKVPESGDGPVSRAVKQRVHALLGVAEGMLDRDEH